MFITASPAPTVEVVALLSTNRSRCEISKRASDEESGDQIEARCGNIRRPLGRALKGVSMNRISACQVVITVNAVHSPRLLDLSNCRGKLVVVDVGTIWTKQLQKTASIQAASTEFVSYKHIKSRTGCYDVTVTYDTKPGAQDTSYQEKTEQFCIQRR